MSWTTFTQTIGLILVVGFFILLAISMFLNRGGD